MTGQPVSRGRLEEIHFAELILQISQRKETGVLGINRLSFQKSVYFEEGRIVFAKSNDPDERLGVLLLRQSKATYRQLEDSQDKVGPGMRLGTVLVLQGYITPEDLYHGVIDQIKGILYSIFDWGEGEFVFQPGPLPSHEVITLNLSTPDVILEGISRIWRWSWVRKAVVSLDAVFRKRDGWAAIAKKMTITPEVKSVIDLLDRPRTLEEILLSTPGGNFQVCKLLWALLTMGIAEQILSAPVAAQPTIPVAVLVEPASPEEITSPIQIPEPAGEDDSSSTVKMKMKELQEKQAFTEEILPSPPSSAPSAMPEVQSVIPAPSIEFSFADLADLTDSATATQAQTPRGEAVREDWEKNVQNDVKDLNERQRYLSEMLHLELGDGATGFLSKILRKSCARYPLVFDGVHLNEFGEFNDKVLQGNIEGNLAEGYRKAFDFLLQEERTMMGSLLEKKIVDAIESGLMRIQEKMKARIKS